MPEDVNNKTGRELLPQNVVEEFQGYSSTHHQRILYYRLSEYTWAEWVICLKEKVLLEQCLPFVLEKVDMDPLTPGLFYKGELLFEVTQIDKAFWNAHMDWYDRFRTIINNNLDLLKKEAGNEKVRDVFIEAFQKF